MPLLTVVGLLCVLQSSQVSASLTVEQTSIVDCLLPGKVRQLGINRTYVARKRPTKTSANDCEIRGGDYVNYDRATIASSLSVWQESASQGEPQAQYFVGEIYEKGMGQDPDYELAVMWYQRAVAQDYQPAMLNLGRLYELGLGVDKDLVKAMNLYRRASGLEDDEIAYASVFEGIQKDNQRRIQELQDALDKQTRRANALQRQTDVLQSDLQRSEKSVKRLQNELRDLQRQLKAAEHQQTTEIQSRIDDKQRQLASEQSLNSTIQSRLDKATSELVLVRQKLANLADGSAPQLALKWPDFSLEGDAKVSRVPAGSVVNVVGAVSSFANVKSFRINGDEYELDANGLFLKSLDVGRDKVVLTVEIISLDDEVIVEKLAVLPSDDINLALHGSAALTQPKPDFGTYHALVIGNNNYDINKGWEALDTAVNDASAVAKVLEEQYGFRVRLELNADRDTMLTALEDMRRSLTSEDNLLVYYAGHGLVDPENDQGYWVPIDGSTDSAVRWISNSSITDQIRAMTARNVMVIADSCYSGSLMRSGIVTLRSGLTVEKKALRLNEDVSLMTRVALSSGGIQPVIDSIENSQHSVFTGALLNVLKNNSELLDADSLATQVAHSVAVATKDNVRQVPRFAPLAAGGHQGGEFYFAPKTLTSK